MYSVYYIMYANYCYSNALYCIPSRSVSCLTGVLAAPEGLEEEGGLASLDGTDDLDWAIIEGPIVGGTIVGRLVGRPIVGEAIAVGGEMVLLTTKLGSNREKNNAHTCTVYRICQLYIMCAVLNIL